MWTEFNRSFAWTSEEVWTAVVLNNWPNFPPVKCMWEAAQCDIFHHVGDSGSLLNCLCIIQFVDSKHSVAATRGLIAEMRSHKLTSNLVESGGGSAWVPSAVTWKSNMVSSPPGGTSGRSRLKASLPLSHSSNFLRSSSSSTAPALHIRAKT